VNEPVGSWLQVYRWPLDTPQLPQLVLHDVLAA